MFTGIVTDVGRLVRADDSNAGRRLRVATRYDVEAIDLGASIALDGICLTVTDKGQGDEHWFDVFAAKETLAVTDVGRWQPGRRINLERALRVGDELGGHIVSGHVDAMATIVGKEPVGEQLTLTIEVPDDLAPFIARKGSVALNGTSLTVNAVTGNRFTVHLIPYTVELTAWGECAVGDRINLEVDQMARYAARLLETTRASAQQEH
ncbi:riboflavin synthase alpha chain [Devosia enhydra]|uniref:Riboflavin synthase n=1 Tax=Devosia enhydra TaxID=665118 RepID=A0A1K2HTD2_9HYPH|nr:riboflavin synthase [Devosia enhydra]SFZ81344.1 riboflavin synthase alpha chain [Devosia enhydra]